MMCDCGASCEEEICHVCYVFNKYSRVNSADLPDWFGVCFGVLHGRAGIFWTQHGHTHTHTHTHTSLLLLLLVNPVNQTVRAGNFYSDLLVELAELVELNDICALKK